MKLLLIVLVLFVFLYSCVAKRYDTYSFGNEIILRPNANFIFEIDKMNFKYGNNTIIDTNAIYLSYKIKGNLGAKGIYYRFYSNGIIQEVIIKDKPIDSLINNTKIGNIGHYKIIKGDKIRIQILRQTKLDPTTGICIIQKGTIKDGNLYLDIAQINRLNGKKDFYESILEGGGGYGGYAALAIIPVGIVDIIIPNKHICFEKTKIPTIKSISKNELKYFSSGK